MSEVPLISTKKQAELLQSSDISKISLRNDEKSGAAHAAPPIPYGYSIARICSIRDCFFCLRIVHTDKISSIPNNTRMNSPISKPGIDKALHFRQKHLHSFFCKQRWKPEAQRSALPMLQRAHRTAPHRCSFYIAVFVLGR